jgi:hypothetical protein
MLPLCIVIEYELGDQHYGAIILALLFRGCPYSSILHDAKQSRRRLVLAPRQQPNLFPQMGSASYGSTIFYA